MLRQKFLAPRSYAPAGYTFNFLMVAGGAGGGGGATNATGGGGGGGAGRKGGGRSWKRARQGVA